jgi:putative ABC transport system permease protein
MSRASERWRSEFRWALRNLRARGWRAPLAAALLAIALTANSLVFSTADSLVFHRVPYRDAERLVEIQQRDPRTGRPGGSFISVALLDEWRKQTDLFTGVHGYLTKVIFLSGSGEPELVQAADVTVGLFELLGADPRWGRSFVEGDDRRTDEQIVVVAESLARQRFGDPSRAIGQELETTADPLRIVGVMPAEFRYPHGSQRIWRALDPRGPLTRGSGGAVSSIARIVPGRTRDAVAALVEQRSVGVGTAAGARAGYTAIPAALPIAATVVEQRRMLLVLVGAALCLLLIACANVASLELANAAGRARTYAIQLAIGASRASLARTALAEGACLVGAAVLAACALAYLGAEVLAEYVTPVLGGGTNPIDIDERALIAMAALAGLTLMASTLPVVLFISRAGLLGVLKLEGPSVAASRSGTFVRRVLTVAQVALAVLLLVGSVLYVRSYLALLRLDKGFDSTGVVAISLIIPPQLFGTAADRQLLTQTILDRVRARPGVIAAFEGSPPPHTGDSPSTIQQLEVDDRPPEDSNLDFPRLWVGADYFSTLRIPLLAGRVFEAGEPPTNVIIPESLARRLWPRGDAVGHRFRGSPSRPWNHVIGVVGHVRTLQDTPTGPDRYFQLYAARQPPPPPAPIRPGQQRAVDAGFSYGFVMITARGDSRARAGELYQAVRAVDQRNILKLEFVDDHYALKFADKLLASRVIGGFGLLAFVIAAAGIYSVMAFLVAHRAHEIGIRIALGADRSRINRLVMGSSLRLVALGAFIGIAGAIGASRWAESQLFGVRAADPATLALVTLGVVATALLATWHPARQATRIDPKVLLKN